MIFKKNDSFSCNSDTVTILDYLGEGAQGEVYLASYRGNNYAFKYFKNIPNEDFVENLKNNVLKGSPGETFLWPKEFIRFTNDTYGYFMDVRPNNYVSFISYLTGKTNFKNYRTMLSWCIELVKSFKVLHEKGYSYQDLNDGSLFLDQETGKLLICDNDNVTADKRNLGILGKMRYMAPEIVRGDKNRMTGERQLPDIHSDRFSLAVILFLALCKGNPFEGECLKKYTIIDEKAEYEMYGAHPVYIFDKNDLSNRPIRGYHTTVLNRYPYLPSYIKEAFHRTFVDGLKDRENGRTTELEWLRLLCKYRDELITCSCGHEYIFGFSENKHNERCPICKNQTKKFTYLQIGKSNILLEPDKEIYESHIDKYSSNYSLAIGKVIVNKNNPALWGIKLRLNNAVKIVDKTGKEMLINSDGIIPILNGLKIQFNEATIGEIFTN